MRGSEVSHISQRRRKGRFTDALSDGTTALHLREAASDSIQLLEGPAAIAEQSSLAAGRCRHAAGSTVPGTGAPVPTSDKQPMHQAGRGAAWKLSAGGRGRLCRIPAIIVVCLEYVLGQGNHTHVVL